MRKRTHARELALQVVYQLDLRGAEVLDQVDELLREQTTDPEVLGFAGELVAGVWEHRKQIDEKIEQVAKNWEIKRMAAIDRNVLRVATFELLFRDDIPALVSINEAIDIAKKFSTPKSGKFVNGILDNIRLTCAPPAKRGPGGAPKPVPGPDDKDSE
jgi:N utilization substance protein B